MHFLLWNNCVRPLVLNLIIAHFHIFVNRQPSVLSNFDKLGRLLRRFSDFDETHPSAYKSTAGRVSSESNQKCPRERAFLRVFDVRASPRTHIPKKLCPITVWGLYRQSEKDGKAVLFGFTDRILKAFPPAWGGQMHSPVCDRHQRLSSH